MLPPNLKELLISLENNVELSTPQKVLISELRGVSKILDSAQGIDGSLDDMIHTIANTPKFWGGDPGRCYVCGQ